MVKDRVAGSSPVAGNTRRQVELSFIRRSASVGAVRKKRVTAFAALISERAFRRVIVKPLGLPIGPLD